MRVRVKLGEGLGRVRLGEGLGRVRGRARNRPFQRLGYILGTTLP